MIDIACNLKIPCWKLLFNVIINPISQQLPQKKLAHYHHDHGYITIMIMIVLTGQRSNNSFTYSGCPKFTDKGGLAQIDANAG